VGHGSIVVDGLALEQARSRDGSFDPLPGTMLMLCEERLNEHAYEQATAGARMHSH
jgi:hypothetical protein